MRIPPVKNQTLWVFILLLIGVCVGFFIPVSRGAWIGYIGKGLLFFLIVFVLYMLLFSQSEDEIPSSVEKSLEENSPDTSGVEQAGQDSSWKGFGEAFQDYYRTFLPLVRNTVVASCVGLYLKKGDGEIEFQAGDTEKMHFERRMPVAEGNLVEQIAKHKLPLLESNLPIGMNLSGIPNLEVRSFVGVPLILEDETVGVLAVGSTATENFGEDDREFLVQCGTIITRVMTLCHRGLRWEMDQEVYKVHLDLEKSLLDAVDEKSATLEFVSHIKKLFSFDRFTLNMRKGDDGIIQYVYGQVDDLDCGVRFPLDEGLNGWVIKRNAPLIVKDIADGDYMRPRYYSKENSKHGLHSFMSIPLSGSNKEAWGSLSLESKFKDQYGEKGREALSFLAIPFQITYELITLRKNLLSTGSNDI